MIAATTPVQRPRDAKLLVIDRSSRLAHAARSRLIDFLQPGDLVIANDAATIPASLRGIHAASGREVEVRLAGRSSLAPTDTRFTAVIFGAGDYHVRTEDRPLPPPLAAGDRLQLGTLTATIVGVLGHPRLVAVDFDAEPPAVWAGIASYGKPIQYAHVQTPLAMWDVWTPVASAPVAFEPPSASFVLDHRLLRGFAERSIGFATITLAAGLSSTGDPLLDRRLPLDEPYRISRVTASAVRRARAAGGRIVAVGTTVVRALEHAASRGPSLFGCGVANQRIGPATTLRIVDAIVSGTHEPDSSHYQLLRALASDKTLAAADAALVQQHYRTHEFGDSVLIEKAGATTVRLKADTMSDCCPRYVA